MTWIETHKPTPAHPRLGAAMAEALRGYPEEYTPAREAEARVDDPACRRDSITGAHTLFPEVLRHMFAGYREMMSPDLPLGRRQQEMIAATVSILNRCHY